MATPRKRENEDGGDPVEREGQAAKHARSSELASDLRDYEPLFILSGSIPEQLVHTRFYEHAAQLHLTELKRVDYQRAPRVMLVWAEMQELKNGGFQYERGLYKVHCALKNILGPGKSLICQKDRLHENLARAYPEEAARFIAETYPCDKPPAVGDEDVFIFRPVDVFGGVGITIIRGPRSSDIARAVEHARRETLRVMPRAQPRVIMSRYVADVLLWGGRKFHLRTYFAAVVARGVFRTHLWDEGNILTAAQPYVCDRYGDAGVHDTHLGSTDGDPLFPADLARGGVTAEQWATIHAAICHVLRRVSALLQPHAQPFEESLHAFEVFGADILVRRDLSVVLMEVNDKIGYGFNNQADNVPFSQRYFDWVHETVLAPVLAGTPPPSPLFSGTAGGTDGH